VGDFVSASLLGGPEQVMIGNLIQQQFQASDNWPFGAALTVVMMTFLLIWMSLYLRAAAREAKEATA
jgi:spermidine/putrescine transport system permease protein